MPWPQCGQRERGTSRLNASAGAGATGGLPAGAAFSAAIAANSASHWRSIILGRRWITTLRKLPISNPMTPASAASISGDIPIRRPGRA